MQKAKNGTADSASLIISGQIPMLRLPSPAPQNLPSESIKGYILAYYYAGLTNLFCQTQLSPVEGVKDNETLKAIADNSYQDFCMLDSWLKALDQDAAQAIPEWSLYLEARQVWRDLVRNSARIAEKGLETDLERPTDLQPAG